MSCSAATAPISGTGSTAVVPVVPTAEQTKAGVRPAATSAATASVSASVSRANCSSTPTSRMWPNPATFAPFSSDEWACADV